MALLFCEVQKWTDLQPMQNFVNEGKNIQENQENIKVQQLGRDQKLGGKVLVTDTLLVFMIQSALAGTS